MRKDKKEVQGFVHIGKVLKTALPGYRGEADMALTQVWSLWDSVVGETIAANARPDAFKGKLLLVNVSSSVWIHQLQFLKKDIIQKINEQLGAGLIEDIKFKIGSR